MANHAHSTRTPLLPLAGALPPLLRQGSGKQPGPVTQALRVMRAADPDLPRIRGLRRAIASRIEADLALLDALGGDPDFEDGADAEPSLCGLHVDRPGYGGDDREAGDDNGMGDSGGMYEQMGRYLSMGGDLSRLPNWIVR